MVDVLIKPYSTVRPDQINFQEVNKEGRKGCHVINPVPVHPILAGNSDCYEFKVASGSYSISNRLVTQFPESFGEAEGRDDAKSDEVNFKSAEWKDCSEDEELEWDPYLSIESEASSVESDSSSIYSGYRFLQPLPLFGDKRPRAIFESTSSLNSTSTSLGLPDISTESLYADTSDSQRYSESFLRQVSFDAHSARESAVSEQSELSLTNSLASSIESVGVNSAGNTGSIVTLNNRLSALSILADLKGCAYFESTDRWDSTSSLIPADQYTDFESTGCPDIVSSSSRYSEGSSGTFTKNTDKYSCERYSESFQSQASRDSGFVKPGAETETPLPNYLSSSSAVSSSVASGLFTNSNKLKAIAGKTNHSTVSKKICDSLITDDPINMPLHVDDKFILKTITYWMGWVDNNSNGRKAISKSGNKVESGFLFWIERNIQPFEQIAEVSQLLVRVERALVELTKRKKKTIYSVISKALSFKKTKTNAIKEQSGAGNINDCYFRAVFKFYQLSKLIDSTGRSKKYKTGRVSILKKIDKETIVEKPSDNFSLLNACINYNLATALLERAYKCADLVKYELANDAECELACNTDYSQITSEDLEVINSLLQLIDDLTLEANSILHEYEAQINGFPRVSEGKSFEERVLHLRKGGEGYTSKPLTGMKSTLLAIQSGCRRKNLLDSST